MTSSEKSLSMSLLESNWVPDWLIRRQIRQLLTQRIAEEDKGDPESQQQHLMNMVRKLRESPIAIHTAEANAQHYEVPTDFYLKTLGKHLKYSSCYFDDFDISRAAQNLDAAEARMLALTCERAGLKDGDRILELGCGWGSLSLWMAAHYPNHASLSSQTRKHRKPTSTNKPRHVAFVISKSSPVMPMRSSSHQQTSSIALFPSKCSSTCGTTKHCSPKSHPG